MFINLELNIQNNINQNIVYFLGSVNFINQIGEVPEW